MNPAAYIVRFKGHACAGVRSGLSRKPILLRANKGEEIFESKIPVFVPVDADYPPDYPAIAARLDCARAIKRTEAARRRLQGDHLLRGAPTVERLLRDHAKGKRRGKRWKICPVENSTQTKETK